MIGGALWQVTYACCGTTFTAYVRRGTTTYPCPRCGKLAPMWAPCCPPWGWAR